METKVVNDVTLTRKLTFNDSVIEKIAGLVCRNVEGVLSLDGGMMSELADRFSKKTDPTKGIDAEVGEKQVALDMDATIEYGLMPAKYLMKSVNEPNGQLRIIPALTLLKLM